MMGAMYGVVFVLCALLLPEPTYNGPENVVYFRTPNSLDEELERDKRIIWIVTFYTTWNPSCVNFAPIFAQISNEYRLDNLKFGKVDIGRLPEIGKKQFSESPIANHNSLQERQRSRPQALRRHQRKTRQILLLRGQCESCVRYQQPLQRKQGESAQAYQGDQRRQEEDKLNVRNTAHINYNLRLLSHRDSMLE